jgi:mannonate dehydratase
MPRLSRRTALKSSAGLLAGVGPAAAVPAKPSVKGRPGGMKFSEIILPGEHDRMRLLKQVGVNYAIGSVTGHLAKLPRTQYLDALARFQQDLREHGLGLAGVESHPVPAEKIKLGLAGRDEELENYVACIKALAELGVKMVCYNFMAGVNWYRTRTDFPERGGALASEFDSALAEREGLTQFGEVTAEQMWDHLTYFLKAIIPVAEKAGVGMALHPDDPPLPKLRGLARIVTSAANYRRIFEIVPSPVNGVTYCQANFVAMGEDVYQVAKEFLDKKKVFFVHYRDIEGASLGRPARRFRETFHDNGPTDMVEMLKIYAEAGFQGPIRPDHAPTLEGEANDRPGYAMKGKIFAFGYMRGILHALNLPSE